MIMTRTAMSVRGNNMMNSVMNSVMTKCVNAAATINDEYVVMTAYVYDDNVVYADAAYVKGSAIDALYDNVTGVVIDSALCCAYIDALLQWVCAIVGQQCTPYVVDVVEMSICCWCNAPKKDDQCQ
jgi:hypothetical protein